jgi:hypothetical protein
LFDSSLDKELYKEEFEAKKGFIQILVMQYGDFDKKIQINRVVLNQQNERKFVKLGRLTPDEAEKVSERLADVARKIKLKEV